MDMNIRSALQAHQATLVGDILLTGVQAATREDYNFALNCTYLAKRQADSIYSSATQPGRWIDYYADVLWSHGWNRDQPSIEYVRPQFSGSVKQAWMSLASGLLSASEVQGVNSGLGSLENNVDLLQKTKGLSGKSFDLKIVPVSYNAAGDLELVITHIRFMKSSLNTQYLFWDISQEMNQLDILARKVLISRRVLEGRRASVEKAVRELPFNFDDIEL